MRERRRGGIPVKGGTEPVEPIIVVRGVHCVCSKCGDFIPVARGGDPALVGICELCRGNPDKHHEDWLSLEMASR